MANHPPLYIHRDDAGKPVAGVGPGVVEEFIKAYYPDAKQTMRIASAYFTLTGYEIGRAHLLNGAVQYRILVGIEEGSYVQSSVVAEIDKELKKCRTDLHRTVAGLIARMENGSFIIRDAREMEVAFHCKFYTCDEAILWHGSGNYTGRGLRISAEQASRITAPEQIRLFIRWFDEVLNNAKDLLPGLIKRLREWYELSRPFDVYLKMLHLLQTLFEREKHPNLLLPVYFQEAVIWQAVRQITAFGGAVVVAATGLGKTVIGSEIAYQLRLRSLGKHVILIAPYDVHGNWNEQLKCRDFRPSIHTIDLLYRNSSEISYRKVHQLDKELQEADQNTILIIDEAHLYRNELFTLLRRTSGIRKDNRGSLVYTRLKPLVERGAKVLLLTATPYGTNDTNLDSILRLLPYSQPGEKPGEFGPWLAKTVQEFKQLPVVTALGLSNVIQAARKRNDVDGNGRVFIDIDGEKHFLPAKICLETVYYKLPLERPILRAFDGNCFGQSGKTLVEQMDEQTRTLRFSRVDSVFNSALSGWLSSPDALKDSIEQNLNTVEEKRPSDDKADQPELSTATMNDQQELASGPPQEGKSGYRKPMLLEWASREKVLRPLLEELNKENIDTKVLHLKRILQQHFLGNKEKVIVFVGRRATAVYLENFIYKAFGQAIKVGCTVEKTATGFQLKRPQVRKEILKNFSPKSQKHTTSQELDVLICTDANGIGVNLQDANVVVNYDPTDGADVLFQRAGRIFRFTTDAERPVYIYTFVPDIAKGEGSDVRKQIGILFDNMTRRHDKSRHLLGVSLLSGQKRQEIVLDNVQEERLAKDIDAMENVTSDSINPLIQHTSVRSKYLVLAQALPESLHSALVYKEMDRRVIVLIQVQGQHKLIKLNIDKQLFEDEDDLLVVLNSVACEPSASCAPINPAIVHEAAINAIQLWCDQNNVPLGEADKICALYLLPKPKRSAARSILDGVVKHKNKFFKNVQ